MKKSIRILTILIFSGLFVNLPSGISAPERLGLVSPNGTLHFFLVTDKDQLALSVTMNGKQIIEQSPLLMSVDGVSITNGTKAGKIRKFSANNTYPLFGLHSVAKDNYNGASIAITHVKSGIKYTLEAKVFNDAVAFRFVVPGNENSVRIPDESTVFTFPKKSILWYHDLYMHYEGVHTKKLIDTIPAGQWAAPPLMAKLAESAGYVAITEANLVNYAGMALQSDGKNGFAVRLGHSHPASYPYVLRYSKEDVARLSKIAEVNGTITTPWRLVIAGKDLNTMVNSDAVYNLCPPPNKILLPGCLLVLPIIPSAISVPGARIQHGFTRLLQQQFIPLR